MKMRFRKCAQCKTNPVKDPRCQFCSTRCSADAKKKPRPLCAQCKTEPVKKLWRGDKFCSRRCAALSRGPEAEERLRRGKVKSMAVQQAKFFTRLNEFLKLKIEPAVEKFPVEQQPAVRQALMKMATEIYRRAYGRGYRCSRNRFYRGVAA